MKYHNPFLFLAVVIAAFWLAGQSRAADNVKSLAEQRAAVALALASVKPPPDPFAASNKVCKNCPCGIDGCPCGCCEGKSCTCSTKKPDPDYAEFLKWKASRKKSAGELSKPYAKEWQSQGWSYDESGGYWTKQPEQAVACYGSACGVAACAPAMTYQPQFMPMMQSFGGFGGGFGGGGGCSGGG